MRAGTTRWLARCSGRRRSARVSGGSFGDLNEDLLGDETLVAYAAAAGTTAADGRGRNSPYTAALLSHLETPLEIGLLFRRVRAQVLASTNGAQRPHEYHSLVSEHYLARTLATGTSVTVNAAAPADPPRTDPPQVDVTDMLIATLRGLAEAGDPDAQTELGERYQGGYGGVRRDYAEAVRWYRRSADQGHALGQAFLGFMYSTGRGVRQDAAEAARWYRRSADQGHSLGQNNLGVLYRDGRGVSQNDTEAVRWFRLSADQGEALGQANLGFMYRDGRGVSQDYGEAVRWFRLSADQGEARGQANLGWMHENGRGVQRDRVEAVRWYRRAAEQGYSWAQEQLDRLR